MSKTKKIITALCLMGLGAGALWGTQVVMHETGTPEFCVSCHSMSHPQQEWEGSSHFANAKGIRAECADCHVPQEGWHYVKAKFIALKDIWYEMQGKLDSKEKYEEHRAEMAQYESHRFGNLSQLSQLRCYGAFRPNKISQTNPY